MTYPVHTVRVGRYLPGVDDDAPWYVGVHTERSSTDGGWSPLAGFTTRAEALEAAAPLTGSLLPDWRPFPAHVPDTDTVQHPCPYDRDAAGALLASHSPVTTPVCDSTREGPSGPQTRSCDDLEASRAS